jgi:hypothetical protein
VVAFDHQPAGFVLFVGLFIGWAYCLVDEREKVVGGVV